MEHRLAYLDVLRLLAVVSVMFGHYVLVGGGATVIPRIINPDFSLPLIDGTKWQLWKFEIFMIETFSTQSAILGVTLFFLVTGYLMPLMTERYSRKGFLVNRFFRIFPVLFVAMIVFGVFVWATQGIKFGVSSYLASWTLTYLIFGVVPVAGVLWTLVIEVLFYACAGLVGKFSLHKLFLLQAILLAIILASTKFTSAYFLMLAAIQAKYLLVITVGSAIFLAEKEVEVNRKISLVFGSFVLAYLGFQLYKIGHEDVSTYNNLGTHLLALFLFLSFYWAGRFGIFHKLPSVLYWLADLAYPIYFLHTAIGLGSMALVRSFSSNPFVMLAVAIVSSIILSWLLHKFVELPSVARGRDLVRQLEKRE